VKVLFFGTPAFAVPGLQALTQMPNVQVGAVITQPDRPAGRGAKIQACPIKEIATILRIPVVQPVSVKKEFGQLQEQLLPLGPFDVGVVIAFGQILPIGMLNLPRAGCINIHASLLPRWRGAAPIQRALLAGDASTGVCLMRMEEGLDTGPVFSRSETPISPEDTLGSLHDRLATLGAKLLAKDLESIVAGDLPSIEQSPEGITYASKISASEGAIVWSTPAADLDRLVRGMNPVPGTFTQLAGKRLKVIAGYPLRTGKHGSPGEVLSALGDRLEIACGEGTFVITELQPEGKRKMTASEFLRGNQLTTGAMLESPMK